MDHVSRLSAQLREQGFAVLGALPLAAVAEARRRVIDHAALLRNTRPNPSAGHMAGFHRFPELEPLHPLVSSNGEALEVLKAASGSRRIRAIGLSDITVNRSQQWHVDLLRGKYRHHLSPDICWGPNGGGVYKVLLYLQPGATLRVIAGAHERPVSLDSDARTEPASAADVTPVDVPAGGIVLMDIRLPHRGSTEEELDRDEFRAEPKILISTVLAGDDKPLGQAMERGNFERMLDWDALHRNSPSPQLGRPAEPAPLRAVS